MQSTFSRRAFVAGLGTLIVPLIAFAQEKKEDAEKKKEEAKKDAEKKKEEAKDKAEAGLGLPVRADAKIGDGSDGGLCGAGARRHSQNPRFSKITSTGP